MIALSTRAREQEHAGCETFPPALDWTKVVRLLVDEGDDLKVMSVHGDSLSDALVNDGDLVFLKPTVTAQNGDMVAARHISTKATGLEYYHRENGHVRLQPPDPALPALQLKANEVEIQGQVIVIVHQVTHGRRLP